MAERDQAALVACCEHPASDHDHHGCTVDVSTDRRVYERCHGGMIAPTTVIESYHYGVLRPDYVLIEGMTEAEARAYVERGNADGSTRYSLCRRPVGPWENLTNPDPAKPAKASEVTQPSPE